LTYITLVKNEISQLEEEDPKPSLTKTTSGGEKEVIYPEDFIPFVYSPSADIAAVELVAANNLGCNATDFDGQDFNGKVALIKRGRCQFVEKQGLAPAAIIYNDGATEDRMSVFSFGTLGSPGDYIPTVSISYADGVACLEDIPTGVKISLEFEIRMRAVESKNLILKSKEGNPDKIIVVMAFHDSSSGEGANR
jgi:hypothetical protein